jgi:hypothetical protein
MSHKHIWGTIASTIMVGKPEQKGSMGKSRLRWHDNVQEMWTGLIWLRTGQVADPYENS